MKRCPPNSPNCGGNWIHRMLFNKSEGAPLEPSLGYGLLYNWYAATDVRGVAPSGFRVPSEADFNSLVATVSTDYDSLKSERVLVDGDPYWDSGAEGNNGAGLSCFGAGGRSGSNGEYFLLRTVGQHWSTTSELPEETRAKTLALGSFGEGVTNVVKKNGQSIRCVSDTEPSTSLVQDADGNNYSWVQIGSQYWLQQSLKTTKYNNGDDIATGLDNTAWSNTTDGAWAYPNGDSSLPI